MVSWTNDLRRLLLSSKLYLLAMVLAAGGAAVSPLTVGTGYLGGVVFVVLSYLLYDYSSQGLKKGVAARVYRGLYSIAFYGAIGAFVSALVVLVTAVSFGLLTSGSAYSHQGLISGTLGGVIALNVGMQSVFFLGEHSELSALKIIRSKWWLLMAGIVTVGSAVAIGSWRVLPRAQVVIASSSPYTRILVLIPVSVSFVSVILERWSTYSLGSKEALGAEKCGMSSSVSSTSAAPFLLVGLDGADWDVVMPLVEQGKLPNLKSLMDRGTYGYLDCHDRTCSPAVWTSIATGMSFEKHGILDFLAPRGDTGRLTPVKSFDRKAKAIWNILSEGGLRTGVLNWLVTFPAETVNGFMISRVIQLVEERGGVYPPEIEEEVVSLARRGSSEGLNGLGEKAASLKHDLNIVSTLRKLCRMLLIREPVDFFAIYYHGTDGLSHRFFRYVEPDRFDPQVWGEPEQEELDRYGDVIERVWCEVDEMIGELISTYGDWATVMICSDHGSRPRKIPKVCLRLNHVLEKMGYLSFDEADDLEVDLDRSRVYWDQQSLCPHEYRIAFNTGVVEDPGKLKDTLAKALRSIRIIETNEPLFGAVFSAPERYPGICIRDAVSISTRQEETLNVVISGETYPLDELVKVNDFISGDHGPTGMFVLSGQGIREGIISRSMVLRTPLDGLLLRLGKRFPALLPELRALKVLNPYTTLDVTPTILYLLGFPVAENMDGAVIAEAIDGQWARSHPLRHISAYSDRDRRGQLHQDDSYESDDVVLERLRELGYIE